MFSCDEEILGIGMTLVGAGRADFPIRNWRENLSMEQQQEMLGTFQTLFQVRLKP